MATPAASVCDPHESIGVEPSRNSTEPVGCTGPECGPGATAATYVVLAPTVIDEAAFSVVELVSGPTTRFVPGLLEPLRIDPDAGVNTALSCAVDAGNEVEQATVALRPLGTAGMPAQPLIAAPPFSNVTVPHSAVLLVPAVTVAITVTLSLVTG